MYILSCNFNCRIPMDTHQPVSFGIALLIEFSVVFALLEITAMFIIIYISVCTYVLTLIDDLSSIMIIERTETAIEQRISQKENFLRFIQLHKDLYKCSDIPIIFVYVYILDFSGFFTVFVHFTIGYWRCLKE